MTNVNNYRISATIVLLLLAVPTTMQSVDAQFGQPQQQQEEEEGQQQEEQDHLKKAFELQLEAIQTLKEQPNLTPENENFLRFLEQQVAANKELNLAQEQQVRELGLDEEPSSTDATTTTAETNATTMTLEEAEAAIANATRVIEEAEYKIEKAEEVIAAGEVIGTHTPRILGHAIGLDTQLKNNNTEGAFEKLDLIFAELKSLSGNLTSMKEAAE